MNTNRTELAAAWIVALALIVAMGAHAFLPRTPPHMGPGVTALQPRPVLADRERPDRLPETDLPLVELPYPSLPENSGSPL